MLSDSLSWSSRRTRVNSELSRENPSEISIKLCEKTPMLKRQKSLKIGVEKSLKKDQNQVIEIQFLKKIINISWKNHKIL